MKRIKLSLVLGLLVATAFSLSAQAQRFTTVVARVATPDKRLSISKLASDAQGGVFDPSIAEDERGTLWMSYSTVQPSPKFGKVFNLVGGRIAFSSNGGVDWTDAGISLNAPQRVQLPWPHNKLNAYWVNEVASLAFDPFARPEQKWKLLWHRYLRVYDGKGPASSRLFEHGWIAYRSAPSPRGPWSKERKLIVGKGYDDANDNTIGPPEMRLDRMFGARNELGRCVVFTEPSMLVGEDGVYVSMHCATGRKDGRIVLMRCDHALRSCAFVGAFLEDADAKKFDRNFDGFSANEMVRRGDRSYLIVTPTREPASHYAGCLIFEIESLRAARLKASGGKPVPLAYVSGDEGTFNGACGYVPGRRGGGVVFGQFWPDEQPQFRLYRSGKLLE